MKWVAIAVIGWLLVMASVFVIGGVLHSARRMVGSPEQAMPLPPLKGKRAAPAATRADARSPSAKAARRLRS